ncbi:MAG TPA: zinc-binding dehydrogenase [Candidatus Dormibacteraeota bacterium]|nr:zinc-binding dehydrogenase [Candidatus Dormibacteraeota bacterium]
MGKTNVVLTIPEPRRTELVERPYPRIKDGYAIVRTELAPVCLEGTRIWAHHDFEVLGGPSGQTLDRPDGLGHEGVGVVEEVNPGSRFRPGERVIVFQGDWCGRCYACRNGMSPTYCAYNMVARPGCGSIGLRGLQEWNGSESGGWAMARYRIAPEAHLYPIPDELPFRYAAAANCSVGAAWSNQELMGVGPGDTVLAAGIGFITMGHVISALHRRATVIALVRNPYRADLLRRMGVQHLIDPDAGDWLERVRALTYDGQGVDHAVDGSGVPYYQEKVIQATRVYGSVNFSGHTPGARLDFSPLDVVTHYARRITGQHDVRMRDREGLVRCLLDWNVQRMIDVMVTHELPMSRAGEAFAIQVSKHCGKVYLRTWE